jgi:hypothetical protein
MEKTMPTHYRPLIIDGYSIFGALHADGKDAAFWHIRTSRVVTGVVRDLVVEGDTLKPAVPIVGEDGTYDVKVTGGRAIISFTERQAILQAMASWGTTRRV